MAVNPTPMRLLAVVLCAALIVVSPGLGASRAAAQLVQQAGAAGVRVPSANVHVPPAASLSAPALGAGASLTPASLRLAPTVVASPVQASAKARAHTPAGSVKGGLSLQALAPALHERVLEPVAAMLSKREAPQGTGAPEDSHGEGRRLQEAAEGVSRRGSGTVHGPEGQGPSDDQGLPDPISKKVAALRSLVAKDKEAGRAEALKALEDGSDSRLELRLTALRIAAAQPDAGVFAAVTRVVRDTKEDWYLRREAARLLAKWGPQLASAAPEAVKALKVARGDLLNHSLHLAAGDALRALGEDPGRDRHFYVSESGMQSKIEEIAQRHKMPEPAKPIGLGKIFGWGLAILFGLWLLAAPAANGPAVNPGRPQTTIEQVQKDTTQAAPQDAAKAAEAPRPADPIERIEENTRKQAEAMDRVAKIVEKNAKEPTGGERVLGILGQLAFPLLFLFLMFYMMRGAGGAAASKIGKAKVKETKSKVRFKDVAGIDDAKTEIEEIIDFLKNPDKFRRVGAKMPKGALLVGEPGGGKTLLVKAVAGETNSNIYSISGSDFVEMFVGVGAARVRDLFEQAKANAPAIIFIDEIDAVGKKRAGSGGFSGGHDEQGQTLNQMLVEMDGFDNSTGVVVLAATNRPDVLDPALLRPGRFDRQIHVPKPDVLGREAILRIHAANVPLGPEVDLQHVARRATGLTGAYLANIVNEAALMAARRAGTRLSTADFDEGADRATIGASRHMTLSDDDKRWTAYHEAGHTMVRLRGRKPQIINKLTIVPKGNKALGFAEMGSEEDVLNYRKSELEQMIAVALGGLVAEEMIFGEHSTGPGSDLEQATRVARAMVERFGMGRGTGYSVSAPNENDPFARRNVSEETARQIDVEVNRILDEAKAEAARILNAHRDEFEALAKAVLERETLQRDEIEAIVPPAPPAK
ncbi:MAG: ATP-dependent zinc metalloprotease FtsH [Elusimicrobia bacterium]|nr:ATP-dependent zinc metalloprotease FtsH [Elusimicrobiota bacterium]